MDERPKETPPARLFHFFKSKPFWVGPLFAVSALVVLYLGIPAALESPNQSTASGALIYLNAIARVSRMVGLGVTFAILAFWIAAELSKLRSPG